jgi:hypothetical protein
LQVSNFSGWLFIYETFWVDDRATARRVERACHKRLKELGKHVRGEWFDISPEDAVAFVEEMFLVLNIEATKGDWETMKSYAKALASRRMVC